MNFSIFDLETTGLPPRGADYRTRYMDFPYIVSLAYKINDKRSVEFIINQEGRKIPEEASKVHGITDEMAEKSSHSIVSVLYLLMKEVQVTDFTVGHNIGFDADILRANVIRELAADRIHQSVADAVNTWLLKERRVCTMMSSVRYCNLPGPYGPKWPKLEELHMKLFGVGFDGAHNSKNDVDATHRCLMKLIELGVVKVPELAKT